MVKASSTWGIVADVKNSTPFWGIGTGR